MPSTWLPRRGPTTMRAASGLAAPHTPSRLVELLESRLALAIDLVPELDYTGGVVEPGAAISFDVRVDNTGTTASPPASARIVLSRDTTLGDEEDVILIDGLLDEVAPGGFVEETVNTTIPIDLPPGGWFLGFIVDHQNSIEESDETNNSEISSDTIVRNAPDIEALLNLTEPSPLPEPGDTIEVTFGFVNASDFIADAHTSRVVLSRDSTFGNGDDRVLFERDFDFINPFDSRGFVETFLIPADLEPGNWRLGVIGDADSDLFEITEINNIAQPAFDLVIVEESRPDLVPDADFSSINTPLLRGQGVSLTFAVSNISAFDAPASIARIFLTLDQVLGNEDDILMTEASVTALEPQQSQTFGGFFTIPSDLAPGSYFLGILADAAFAVDEQDETNNTPLSPQAVITVFSPADVNIVIFGGSLGSDIINHETKAQRSRGTGFGPVLLDGATKSATFVIFNGGNDPLLLSGIEPRGQRPGDFAVTVLPDFVVAPGSTTTFTVTFDPLDFGTRRANIAIFSSDPDRPRFTMRIAGRGMPDASAPDIEVTGGTAPISDNDRKARVNTGARFGPAQVGGEVVRIFTITNTAESILTFNAPVIRVAGANPGDFQITAFPAHANLAPGATTTFTIRFAPTAVGLRRATIEVLSDDPDEGVFDFRVTGTGL